MVKNWWLAGALWVVGCHPDPAADPDTFQGVVEHDERVLAFEVPGRLRVIKVDRGDAVAAGAVVATLDDSTERLALDRSRREAEAAAARAGLVRAGSRGEEIRAMEAQIRAAAAAEGQLARELQRTETLTASGARPPAALEEAGSRLHQATAEREALAERLDALKHGARPAERAGADAEAAAASAAVALEENRLAKHELRAPGAGTVLDRHVEPGEVVGAGSP